MSDLLPCPFDGAKFTTRDLYDDGEWLGFDVHCHLCGFNRVFESKEEALRILNTRQAAPVEARGEAYAELVAACNEFFVTKEDCQRCEGSGKLWADGKAHFPNHDGPLAACPDCQGTGEVPAQGDRIQRALASIQAIAALKPAPVSQGGAVSEDGFMACAEHGPYHVDDSEAFQCPACGAAIKAPAAPANKETK